VRFIKNKKMYFIRFQAPDGTWIERRGSVMLVR
jgi:hypothetical protein